MSNKKKAKIVVMVKPKAAKIKTAEPESTVTPAPVADNSEQPKKTAKERALSKKTGAKRIGVKSTIAINDDVAVTSFGKGNAASLAYRASKDGKAVKLNSTKMFTTAANESEVTFSKRELSAVTPNPANVSARAVGQDYLGVKDELENEFFGRTFPNDNIRIQIAHQILDIRKIFGLYVNDIVYSVNNLQRVEQEDGEPYDLIGTVFANESLDDVERKAGNGNEKRVKKSEDIHNALAKMAPYFGYFGDAFKSLKKPVGKNAKPDDAQARKIFEHNYNVLRILSFTRQFAIHGKYEADLFDIKKNLRDKYDVGLFQMLEDNFAAHIDGINKNFVENSSLNLSIIFKLLDIGDERRPQVCREFYRYAICKDGKNLGINVTKLRELALKKYFAAAYDSDHDTYRKKINNIADFIIGKTLSDNPDTLNGIIARLRFAQTDADKDAVYNAAADQLWKDLGKTLERIPDAVARSIKNDVKNGRYAGAAFPPNWIDDVKVKPSGVSPFSLLISYVCNFLEGKEINELLSGYISYFENIRSFCQTLTDLGERAKFAEKYEMFNPENLIPVIDELRLIHSVGKMKPDMADAKRQLYKDAIDVLGIDAELPDDWFEDNLWVKNKEKNAHPFRNFIANNVIESNRFWYVIRYTNPKTCKAVIKNIKVIEFVLSKLPKEQIDRYYAGVIASGDEDTKTKTKIKELAKKLEGFSFQTVLNERNAIINKSNVERLKALVGLYLTVLYVLTKNMVKTNARYFIAWQCVERDSILLKNRIGADVELFDKDDKLKAHYAVTEYYLKLDAATFGIPDDKKTDKQTLFEYIRLQRKKRRYTKRWFDILSDNVARMKELELEPACLVRQYRNIVAHLGVPHRIPAIIGEFLAGTDVPMTSYFELFHFALQKMLFAKYADRNIPSSLKYFSDKVDNYRSPNHDFIKLLNVPFAYNLARYKNLSVMSLFDERDGN
ncbi:MAG: type VI-D CRISPR-associated RNA-guided ribonuclease Cas13d [Clostridiales bacterium]|jgi:hypothetical protein|nr:type VI-D CRISPR-associated RNA-guided ribonuclease Cas13d [Clostridiales bacterium]